MVRKIVRVGCLGMALTLTACGGDDGGTEGGGDVGGGDIGGSDEDGDDGSSGSMSPAGGSSCFDAFAELPGGYLAIDSDWGGVAVDELGLVFSALPEANGGEPSDLPSLLLSATLDGEVSTVYETQDLFTGSIATAGEDVYAVIGLFARELVRLPRTGGEPVTVSDEDERVFAGPISDGQGKLYYATRHSAASGGWRVYALDTATGESTALASGSELSVDGISIDGDGLYLLATEGAFTDDQPIVYRVPLSGGTLEVATRLSPSMLRAGFAVANGAVFGSGLTAEFDIQIHRAEFGEDYEVAADDAGVPFLIADGSAYYGSTRRGGVTRDSLTFDSPSMVPGSERRSVTAIGVSPTDIWYAADSCLYRVPR